jgi:hypothetical protein
MSIQSNNNIHNDFQYSLNVILLTPDENDIITSQQMVGINSRDAYVLATLQLVKQEQKMNNTVLVLQDMTYYVTGQPALKLLLEVNSSLIPVIFDKAQQMSSLYTRTSKIKLPPSDQVVVIFNRRELIQ